jgi:uncharacterized protein involved in response to NO
MGRSLALFGDAPQPGSRPRFAITAKGFRPFFVLAAAYATLIVPLWLAILTGRLASSTYLLPSLWHAHEMIFGFTVAVIAGFLLTAVGNWTQRETAVGAPLAGLAALWIAGRVAMACASWLPGSVVAAIDLAFLPALVLVLARPLVAAKSRRNFVMLGVLTALFAANAVVHANALGVVSFTVARTASGVAVDLVVLVILVIAGRVFPMFTRNATGVTSIRSIGALDVATVAGMVALVAIDVAPIDARLAGVFAGIVGLLAAARAVHWGALHTRREPLLWILHAGYAWVVLGLLLRCVAAFVPVLPSSLPLHALSVGAIGSLTLGMMARVSLGHTGRLLAAPRAIAWAFGAMTAAAVVRVVAPILLPTSYAALVVAGGLWSAAFVAFLGVFAPILSAPRLDGKPG